MLEYRTFEYKFGSKTNETVRGVIRMYNDMNLTSEVIDQLIARFNELNEEVLPPHLGTVVQVPVLLPFCFKHEK